MSRRILVAGLALSLTTVLGAATPASSGEFTTKAKIVDFSFQPKRIEIGQGTSVKWVNKGSENHTVTSNKGLFDSGNLAPGDTFRKKFKQTGVFKFHCEVHPDMRGRVISGDV
ncbi:MAG: cupredoxin domain-containing protein [Actinomycetota bacterium]